MSGVEREKVVGFTFPIIGATFFVIGICHIFGGMPIAFLRPPLTGMHTPVSGTIASFYTGVLMLAASLIFTRLREKGFSPTQLLIPAAIVVLIGAILSPFFQPATWIPFVLF